MIASPFQSPLKSEYHLPSSKFLVQRPPRLNFPSTDGTNVLLKRTTQAFQKAAKGSVHATLENLGEGGSFTSFARRCTKLLSPYCRGEEIGDSSERDRRSLVTHMKAVVHLFNSARVNIVC